MNMYTKQIAKLLNVSIDVALKVQEEMECNGFDFSEASARTFNREVKATFASL